MESRMKKLGRKRCDNAGNSVKKHFKRKREMLGRESLGEGKKELGMFKKSKKR